MILGEPLVRTGKSANHVTTIKSACARLCPKSDAHGEVGNTDVVKGGGSV